jgi:hypothetical protein
MTIPFFLAPVPEAPGGPRSSRRTGSRHARLERITWAMATFAAALLLPVAGAAQTSDSWCDDPVSRGNHCEVREFELDAPDGFLSVDARANGAIQVEGWDGDHVRAEARVVTRARSADAARDMAEDVEIRTRPGEIESSGPRTWRSRESWSVSYRIQVPRGTALALENTNGSVRVAGVEGPVELSTTNGGITLDGVTQWVRARTTNGGIEVSMAAGAVLDEDSYLRSTNGGITLRLPSTLNAQLQARTTNGSISSELPLAAEASVRRQSLNGTLGSGGAELRLQTTNGGIRIVER